MSEIVQSLFGVTPQAYQRAQQDRVDAQALRFAELDPFQRAQFGIARGANMLGGAIGGALGGQDPELQRITMRQQIAGQLNPNDPASIQQAIAALQQAGDAEGAMMLQGEFRKMQESGALIAQRGAATQASLASATRERAPPTTTELTNARAIAATAGPEGSPEYNAAFNEEYRRLTTKESTIPKSPAVGTNREAFSAEMYDKPFAELTQAERQAVNKRVQDEGGSGQSINVNIQNSKDINQAQEVIKAATAFDKAIEGPTAQLNTAQNVKTLINQAARSNNSQAFEASRTTLAKLVGESRLSNEDIARTGIDPRLIAGALDWVSKKFDGVPNEDVMKQMFAVAQALEDSATTAINRQADRQRKIAEAAGFQGNLDDFFPRAPIAAGDTEKAKEDRYQAYKRAQEGK